MRADAACSRVRRLDEENTRKDMAALMEGGEMWEKVARLVDLQPKANEETSNKARIRKLLVQVG